VIDPYGLTMLRVLSSPTRWHTVYGGTVPEHVVAKRRARNKVARRSRRINRLRAT
jgi:hypothetical protein